VTGDDSDDDTVDGSIMPAPVGSEKGYADAEMLDSLKIGDTVRFKHAGRFKFEGIVDGVHKFSRVTPGACLSKELDSDDETAIGDVPHVEKPGKEAADFWAQYKYQTSTAKELAPEDQEPGPSTGRWRYAFTKIRSSVRLRRTI
jgi:hypothetical protein